jgi:flagellar hook assembly protein FlgD
MVLRHDVGGDCARGPYYRPRLRRFAVIALVLLLIVATTTAFAVTQALKLERSPVARVVVDHIFSPTCDCRTSSARIAFRLREPDRIDLQIVDGDGNEVRTLVTDSSRAAGAVLERWDGRADNGTVVPDGTYRLRIHLDEANRTILVPRRIRVDTEPPSVELLTLTPTRLSPDGDGVRDRATMELRLGERARPIVLVDGEAAKLVGWRDAGPASAGWDGDMDGRPLDPGRYDLTVQARDEAGNVSAASDSVAVRIRYIELARVSVSMRDGIVFRVRVRADAPEFRVLVFRRPDLTQPVLSRAVSGSSVSVSLPRRFRSGDYLVRVAAAGHSDGTDVIVRAGR